jgi:hypothetical protein
VLALCLINGHLGVKSRELIDRRIRRILHLVSVALDYGRVVDLASRRAALVDNLG